MIRGSRLLIPASIGGLWLLLFFSSISSSETVHPTGSEEWAVDLLALVSAPTEAEDPAVRDSSSNTPKGLDPNRWIWKAPTTAGNWGLEAMHVPQLWNLNDAVKRRGHSVFIGIVDAGFQDDDRDGRNDHPDLAHLETIVFDGEGDLKPGAIKSAHGQHVAGIIGAAFNNHLGIDGVNPFARMIALSPKIPKDERSLAPSWGVLLEALSRLLKDYPEIRVVNLSLSYNWAINGRLKIDPNFDEEAQRLVEKQGILVRLLARAHPDVLFVAAAGNDSRNRYGFAYEIRAKWASPINWAALGPTVELSLSSDKEPTVLEPSANILVIEAIDDVLPGEMIHRKSDFSNVGGHLSAPGGRVMSTVLNGKYDTFDGTSMAAPHVTGLIGYLLAFDPTLTVEEIKQLLFETSRPVAGEVGGKRGPEGETAAPRVDGFAAALAIDSIRPGDPVQRALVDVDDCTLDGNPRLDREGQPVTSLCPDGLRGDGNIDMRDFRAFRDALLYSEGLQRNLDGAADHPKKDLNGDGCVHEADPGACPYPESLYPRFDFNGDGIISRSARAPFKGGLLTDLEVLMAVWGRGPGADTEGWRAEDLPRLLESADLHLDLSGLFERWGLDQVIITTSRAPERLVRSEAPELVVTVPAYEPITVRVQGMEGDHVRVEQCAELKPLEPGQDLWVELGAC